MIENTTIISALITLLVAIDPPGLLPIFLGVTEDMNKHQRHFTALFATIVSFAVLAFFAFGGISILATLGISMGAFQVAGGILLFTIAFEMIFEKRSTRKEKSIQNDITKDHIRNVAAFPLAVPMIAGPGSISATILIASDHHGIRGAGTTLFIILISVIICYGFMALAGPIDRLLGSTGRSIVTRLFGLLLAALAVQFVANGIRTLL